MDPFTPRAFKPEMMKSCHLYWTTAAEVLRWVMSNIQMGERSPARVGAEMRRQERAASLQRAGSRKWFSAVACRWCWPCMFKIRRDVAPKPLDDSKHIDITVDDNPRAIYLHVGPSITGAPSHLCPSLNLTDDLQDMTATVYPRAPYTKPSAYSDAVASGRFSLCPHLRPHSIKILIFAEVQFWLLL